MKRLRLGFELGFDIWGLVLFLLVMLPNIIWFFIPAPNDVLRRESVTPIVDIIASVFQILTIACLCFVIKKERPQLRFSSLIISSIASIIFYYIGWVLYYTGFTGTGCIILLTVPPCLAFILFALDRKNLPAFLFATGFAICHLIFAIVNFII